MSTDTYRIDGRLYNILDGEPIEIDSRPPAGYTATEAAPSGRAMLPCRVCREPLDAVLTLRGAHLGCLPEHRAYGRLRICGGTWTTLIPVYRGERTGHHGPGAPREVRSTTTRTRGGVAA
jgi:hypothetical protein